MGWKPAGAPGGSVAVGAAWILLESQLTKWQGWFSSSLNWDKSPDVIGSFPAICHKQIIVATASLGDPPGLRGGETAFLLGFRS